MNTSRLGTTLAATPRETRIPFNLLIAYEDQPTRHRALHLSHHLSRQFVDDYDFRCSWWKFDHLANDILREQATHAAGEANMIVLALNAGSRLSALQSQWIESWLPLQQKKRALGGLTAALVALVAAPEPSQIIRADQATEQLRALAASARLDFFAHTFDLPKAGAAPSADEDLILAETASATPNAEQRFQFKMPIPRWGINE